MECNYNYSYKILTTLALDFDRSSKDYKYNLYLLSLVQVHVLTNFSLFACNNTSIFKSVWSTCCLDKMKLGTIRTAETTTKMSSTTGLHTCMCFISLLVLGLSHMRLMTWSLMSSVDILGTNCDQCVCMVQCCFTCAETIRLIRTGSPGRPLRLPHSSFALTHATSYRAKFIR